MRGITTITMKEPINIVYTQSFTRMIASKLIISGNTSHLQTLVGMVDLESFTCNKKTMKIRKQSHKRRNVVVDHKSVLNS